LSSLSVSGSARSPGGNGSAAAWAGYAALAEHGTVTLAFCWAHARLRFYEIQAAGPAPIATEALARIGQLHAIEAGIRGRPAEERRQMRQEQARPILEVLKPWLERQLGAVSRKAAIAEAIRYVLTRWDGLVRFVEDGRIELDSNVVERTMRPIAVARS
jgi:transposase